MRWLDEVLSAGGGATRAGAWVYLLRGYLAVLQGSALAAVPVLELAVVAARESGQPGIQSSALSLLAIADNLAGHRPSAVRHLEDAKAIAEAGDDLAARLTLFQATSLDAFFADDVDAARSAAAEGARIGREMGAATTLALMLVNLGFAALMSADIAESKAVFEAALTVAREVDDRITQYYALSGIACVTAHLQRPKEAAQLMGATEGMQSATGVRLNPVFVRVTDDAERTVARRLGSQGLEAQRRAGRALTRESAMAGALGEAVGRLPADRDEVRGRRQTEVARLVAEGLSNTDAAGSSRPARMSRLFNGIARQHYRRHRRRKSERCSPPPRRH